eukprot:COSAG01_NODE_8112_length_2916_cov_1.794817_2_plen_57_part_00
MKFKNRNIWVYDADVTSARSAGRAVDAVLAEFLKIDILVNAVGAGQEFMPCEESSV